MVVVIYDTQLPGETKNRFPSGNWRVIKFTRGPTVGHKRYEIHTERIYRYISYNHSLSIGLKNMTQDFQISTSTNEPRKKERTLQNMPLFHRSDASESPSSRLESSCHSLP
jgi:hypothetical protein